MKILLCNVPIREKPTEFPPIACTILYNALKRSGYNPSFYNIDDKRPDRQEVYNYFKEQKFDIVGISAVVSTGYSYVKFLSGLINEACPKTKVILGGNLAAAYNVILNKCSVDICVIGRGEKTLIKILEYFKRNDRLSLSDELSQIKGVAFLDADKKCVYTGCQEAMDEEVEVQPDYALLEKYSNIHNYIIDPLNRFDFSYDSRSHQPHRLGKKAATLITSKGCVNRCTFCHRWIKGYRIFPVKKIVAAIKELQDKYNVGFFIIEDECFGESKRWIEEFLSSIEPLDILFTVTGARVSLVDKDHEIIYRLKKSGMTAIYFGVESGSEKILKVMDKNADREQNLKSMKICAQEGVYSIIQLVIGMPGENQETIKETMDFVKAATVNAFTPTLSINYLQALPGTSTYDYLKHCGLIAEDLESEEQYLIKISDSDAASFDQYLNVSEEPISKVKLWRSKIAFENEVHWLKNHNWKFPEDSERKSFKKADSRIGLYSRIISNLLPGLSLYRMIDLLGENFWKILLVRQRLRIYGPIRGVAIALGLAEEEDRSKFKICQGESLREILKLNFDKLS